ncbi:histidinol-phosphatase [Propionigenium maris DSM 9537]|uniref:Histidinol-phosphatase n=1 Tax=Propionigenium maris DSM 9537 TaxID=1123000 RepID=A0A9W6GK36_9FUSO|nr:PHP domain-containing protein [Propionigenium maris]GLI55738.1 histidinol-phosphatase [Propionigenium maris DSM 9537]
MLLDMHMHIWPTSRDSHMTLEDAVDQARELGLDGICVTDHDNLEIRERAAEYSRKTGYPIFVGVEILTYQGDVVVFGLDEVPEEMLHVGELLDLVEKRGGAAIVAHPFRRNNRGLGEGIKDVYERLTGVEVLNGNTPIELNIEADNLTRRLEVGRVGASDAHYKHEVGRYATKFSRKISSVEELICELREGKFLPATYDEGIYHLNDGTTLRANKFAGIIKKGA